MSIMASIQELVADEDVNLATWLLQRANFSTGLVPAARTLRQSKSAVHQIDLAKYMNSIQEYSEAELALEQLNERVDSELAKLFGSQPGPAQPSLVNGYLANIQARVNHLQDLQSRTRPAEPTRPEQGLKRAAPRMHFCRILSSQTTDKYLQCLGVGTSPSCFDNK